VPDEARQPSVFIIEMVPIHTKLIALGDGRKDCFFDAFLPMQEGILFFRNSGIFLLVQSNSIFKKS
jgi:hypothetical protein